MRPRVLPSGDALREPVLLEELVADRLERGPGGHLHLIGPPGSGRTKALRHLAYRFGARGGLVLLDRTPHESELDPSRPDLVVSTGSATLFVTKAGGAGVPSVAASPSGAPSTGAARCETRLLAPWSADDRLEYLLARHPAACGSVLARCKDTFAWLDLAGHAALWAACLDELAREPAVRDVVEALARVLERALDAPASHAAVWDAARENSSARLCLAALEARRGLLQDPPSLEAWLRPWRPHTVEAVASLFPLEQEAVDALERLTLRGNGAVRCKALGVLHLVDPTRSARALLSPEREPIEDKWRWVTLPGIALPGASLRGWRLQACCLQRADLTEARLEGVHAARADFSRARLRGSLWASVDAPRADFSRASARGAVLWRCAMRRTNWTGADLGASRWDAVAAPECALDGASVEGAILRRCRLAAAELGSVDLSRAELDRCDLSGCDFRAARLEGTVVRNSRLCDTEWSGVAARGVELSQCDLCRAHFAGSVLTGCSLLGSSLVEAGLAHVTWVGCDLSGVDFTHASFHLGSTRSGLLLGAPPSFGTRTGFYPRDEVLDANARPEQVRKADLRECDLRGASLGRCDFYLVDLRGALLSREQVGHLRRCKAILDREPRLGRAGSREAW